MSVSEFVCYRGMAYIDLLRVFTYSREAAMARVLRELGAETTLVIAHGLASDTLYGDFDAIDIVEKVSKLRKHLPLYLSVPCIVC
tara:strand:- start:174 stop:428 length:255 start_codon:yes stop_codon:yes gene_type:complete